MIARKAKSDINDWIANGKDALLVTGSRQTGKTYLIRNCLEESGHPYVEFNFIERPELGKLFNDAQNADDLLMRLSLVSDRGLEKGKTVIFFDEVQECREIVTKIKFLVEDGSFRYVMSGSLLGVELYDIRSAPVGYMRILEMFPLAFDEFASALGINNEIIELLRVCYVQRKPVDEFIHNKMLDVFHLYLIVGGMPEAVSEYLETNDLAKTAEIHEKIIQLYRQDFTKYEFRYKLRLREIYDAMPGQLNQSNKRFKLNTISKGMSYDRAANDFLWLKDAGVAIPVYNISEPKAPLLISENRSLFKLFFSDVGLLTSRYPTQIKIAVLNKDRDINNGALYENAVAQELLAKGFKEYYFNSKKQGELDFVIEVDGRVTPIEVKSGKGYKRHSALDNVLGNDDYGIDEAFILSEGNVEVLDKRTYLPIYMIMFIENTKLDKLIYKVDLSGLDTKV